VRPVDRFNWAIAEAVPLFVRESSDKKLFAQIIREHRVEAIIHFAASIVVMDSVADPFGYHKNNTTASRALIECAVKKYVRQFTFSSTAAVYRNPERSR
jgi:UDP-glucose 4-epimerase